MIQAKNQSAMEYLTTYGWAILIIAIVLGALFELGVFSGSAFVPTVNPGSCIVQRPYGPGTTEQISLQGTCNNGLPKYVSMITDGYVEINSESKSSMLNLTTNNITITAWVYVNGSQSTSQSQDVIDRENSYGMELHCNPSSGNCGLEASLGYNFNQYGSFPMHKWVFLAISSQDNHIYWYINGTQVGTETVSDPIITPTFYDTYIGCDMGSGGCPNDGIDGYISNVQVYNTMLSSNGISALYAEGIGGDPIDLHGLLAWWPLNGNGNDYSGNGNNGNAVNMVYLTDWESNYQHP